MVEVYRKPQMNYKEEAAETCTTLRTVYAGDKDVVKLCGPAVALTDSAAKPIKPATDSVPAARKSPR